MTSPDLQQTLLRERPYLLGIAYRMLGSASDAEDIVQEALLRAAHGGELRSARAFLTTVVTRLCLDELGSARRRRETYVGPYLPEPVLTDGLDIPVDGAELRENVSLALLIVLDQLSPAERAVFVLRDVFDLEFAEIAAALERNEASCRKLLQRAREQLARAQLAPPAAAAEQQAVSHAFFRALTTGDLQALVELLAEDVATHTDHGGKASAARNSLQGASVVARLLIGLAKKGLHDQDVYDAVPAYLNGAPGIVVRHVQTGVEATFTLRIANVAGAARIVAIDIMRNPDKLAALGRKLTEGDALAANPRARVSG